MRELLLPTTRHALTLAATLALLSACTADEPKRDDANGAEVQAGDRPEIRQTELEPSDTVRHAPPPARPAEDAPAAVGETKQAPPPDLKTPDSRMNAPKETAKKVPVEVKTAPAAPTSANANANANAPKTMTTMIFDRIIVKPNQGQELDKDALKALAEKRTGAQVEAVKNGALGMMLIRFAPTDPPRTAAQQQALVDKLQDKTRFKYVEGDKLMVPK